MQRSKEGLARCKPSVKVLWWYYYWYAYEINGLAEFNCDIILAIHSFIPQILLEPRPCVGAGEAVVRQCVP